MTVKNAKKEPIIEQISATEERPIEEKKTLRTYGDALPKSDIIWFNGPLLPPVANKWSEEIKKNRKGNKVANVFFCTCGGSPDEAFRMMRLLQDCYDEINVFVFGECYSAGTLFALGANKIFMSHNAQLGPLDIQIRRDDENARMSGECYREALKNLNILASVVFGEQFSRLKNDLNFPISTATASKIASDLTVGLLAPISSQIEPSKLGETMRAQNIGIAYGIRLMQHKYSRPVANRIVGHLATGYFSHSTVIDFREAICLGLDAEQFDPDTYADGAFSKIAQDFLEQKYAYEITIATDMPLKK